jgi:hypothetical protein
VLGRSKIVPDELGTAAAPQHEPRGAERGLVLVDLVLDVVALVVDPDLL